MLSNSLLIVYKFIFKIKKWLMDRTIFHISKISSRIKCISLIYTGTSHSGFFSRTYKEIMVW